MLRFLGRKVYVSILVLLVTSMTQGPSPKRLCAFETEHGISPHTVRRWSRYWRETFVIQNAWRYHRGNLLPPIDEEGLPHTLLARLEQSAMDKLSAAIALLRLAIDSSLDPHPQRSL